MVPAFFVNLHACGGGLSAIQFETAGSAQTMLSATPSRGMSLMVAGGVSLCELRPEDGRFVQRRHTPNSRPHAVSGSAQIAMPSPLRSNHLRKKRRTKNNAYIPFNLSRLITFTQILEFLRFDVVPILKFSQI